MGLPVKGIAGSVEGVSSATLARVLAAIVGAATEISGYVRSGALLKTREMHGERNVHGEVVHSLDALGTDTFVSKFVASGVVAGLVCEELVDARIFETEQGEPGYLCVLDPIDGTSNADIAVTIGSIFGIFPSTPDASPVDERSFLRPASDFSLAGYVLYGSSTVLVVATPGRVQEFTLDETTGAFRSTRARVRIPDDCPYYSVNQGYEDRWASEIQGAVRAVREGRSLRYVGSLVSDFHRNLVRGGVFLYPADTTNPEGKIRVLYEAAVFAYIAEQAGGSASTGYEPILSLVPKSVHERSPLFVGNTSAVEQVEHALSNQNA